MLESCYLPEIDELQATTFLRQLFAVEGQLRLLDGERDLNFLVDGEQGRYVFKIANAIENPEMLECQHQVFELLQQSAVFPQIATAIESANAATVETIVSAAGCRHCCRLLPFIEGQLMSSLQAPSIDLLLDIGWRLGLLDKALFGFEHSALKRPFLWHMPDVLQTIENFKPLLADQPRRELVEFFSASYRARVVSRHSQLRRSVIHNDANDNNILIAADGKTVISIIDFGDMVDSWLIVEPAIAAAYAMLGRDDPLPAAAAILTGYHRSLPLEPAEVASYYDFICMRLCMSVCICAYQCSLEPDNDYLRVSEVPAWKLLQTLRQIPWGKANRQFSEAVAAVS